MIEIKGADVVKSGTNLFRNFNWKISANEHWVVSGGNGSGKTTLLEMLAGIVHVPRGEVKYDFIPDGTWDERYAARKKNIHYIPAHAIQSLLHSQQELYYQQRYYGIGDERVPRVRDLLGTGIERLHTLNIPSNLSIDHLLDLEATRLSNGQLKKVLLIRSLINDVPKFLLLDYPFEGLDFASRIDLCNVIDFMAAEFSMQLIIVDHHHHLPKVINKRLVLESFAITREEVVIHHEPKETFTALSDRTSIKKQETTIPIVEINNLQIKYGDTVILKDFNWNVNKGDRWALVGRNGAGKTTLFSMIFADHPMAYSQDISLFGKRRGSGESIWDIKQRISYLGPELMSYLDPKRNAMSSRQYVRTITKKWSDSNFAKLIDHFEAGEFIDKPVRILSSGQIQLMLILSCFMTEKELLLLDEPFQFLDLRQTENLRNFLQTHIQPETTLILITHYEQDLITWTEQTKKI